MSARLNSTIPTEFTVKFFKTLCNDHGHECRTLQGSVRVANVMSITDAIETARKEFARQRRLPTHLVSTFDADAAKN